MATQILLLDYLPSVCLSWLGLMYHANWEPYNHRELLCLHPTINGNELIVYTAIMVWVP